MRIKYGLSIIWYCCSSNAKFISFAPFPGVSPSSNPTLILGPVTTESHYWVIGPPDTLPIFTILLSDTPPTTIVVPPLYTHEFAPPPAISYYWI